MHHVPCQNHGRPRKPRHAPPERGCSTLNEFLILKIGMSLTEAESVQRRPRCRRKKNRKLGERETFSAFNATHLLKRIDLILWRFFGKWSPPSNRLAREHDYRHLSALCQSPSGAPCRRQRLSGGESGAERSWEKPLTGNIVSCKKGNVSSAPTRRNNMTQALNIPQAWLSAYGLPLFRRQTRTQRLICISSHTHTHTGIQ